MHPAKAHTGTGREGAGDDTVFEGVLADVERLGSGSLRDDAERGIGVRG